MSDNNNVAYFLIEYFIKGFPWWVGGNKSACQCRRHGFNPGLVRSTGEGNGNPVQYSCLGSPMARGTCCATVHGVTKKSYMT